MSTLYSSKCPACGHSLTSLNSWLSACDSCDLELSNLQPGHGTGIQGLEELRRANYQLLLDFVSKITPLQNKRLLEVGSAKGWFLQAALERGCAVVGVEPEVKNAEMARAFGFKVDAGLFPALPIDKGPYDFVVFNDVFEHLPNPTTAIKHVEDLLTPGGIAIINLPSSRGFLYRTSKILSRFGIQGPHDRMWQKGLPSPHISYFSPENLRLLVERHSLLRQVADLPLPSLSHQGLKQRIDSQPNGLPSFIAYPALWLLTFVASNLPSDIHVGIFRKP